MFLLKHFKSGENFMKSMRLLIVATVCTSTLALGGGSCKNGQTTGGQAQMKPGSTAVASAEKPNAKTGLTSADVIKIIESKDQAQLDGLCAKGINAVYEHNATALHFAASLDSEAAFDTFVACQADLKATDVDGYTVLHHAAKVGSTKIVKKLLAANMDKLVKSLPKAGVHEGYTALDAAQIGLDRCEVFAQRDYKCDQHAPKPAAQPDADGNVVPVDAAVEAEAAIDLKDCEAVKVKGGCNHFINTLGNLNK
jgi:hypothetical protein